MRKVLIQSLLIILFLMTSILITSGLSNGNFGIESFVELQQKTLELNKEVNNLQSKNTSEYKAKKQALLEATSHYKEQKAEYEKIANTLQSVGDTKDYEFDLYDIDFLWTIIGNYATEEGIVLQFDVSKVLNESPFSNADYILCNLNFTVSGEYGSIVNFIYNLEDDERLGFEIHNFAMKKTEENIQSTFVVKSIPINNKNLSIAAKP